MADKPQDIDRRDRVRACNGPDDRLCQIAFKPENGPAVSGLFNPGKPISIDAMVVHHITDKMVADKPPFKESDEYERLKELVSDINNVIVAHNARLDMQMLQMEDLYTPRVICTLELARYLDKTGVIPKYKLQYLRYFLGLDKDHGAGRGIDHVELQPLLICYAL